MKRSLYGEYPGKLSMVGLTLHRGLAETPEDLRSVDAGRTVAEIAKAIEHNNYHVAACFAELLKAKAYDLPTGTRECVLSFAAMVLWITYEQEGASNDLLDYFVHMYDSLSGKCPEEALVSAVYLNPVAVA